MCHQPSMFWNVLLYVASNHLGNIPQLGNISQESLEIIRNHSEVNNSIDVEVEHKSRIYRRSEFLSNQDDT